MNIPYIPHICFRSLAFKKRVFFAGSECFAGMQFESSDVSMFWNITLNDNHEQKPKPIEACDVKFLVACEAKCLSMQ